MRKTTCHHLTSRQVQELVHALLGACTAGIEREAQNDASRDPQTSPGADAATGRGAPTASGCGLRRPAVPGGGPSPEKSLCPVDGGVTTRLV